MTNSRRETIQALCDCATVIPYGVVIPAAALLLAWMAGDYLFGSMFRAIGF